MGEGEAFQAHLYILNNTSEVQSYLSTHKTYFKSKHPRMSEKWALKEYNKTFSKNPH